MVVLIADRLTEQVRAFEMAASRLGLPSTVFRAAGGSAVAGGHVSTPSADDEMRAAGELLQMVGGRLVEGLIPLGDRAARIAAVVARHSGIPWHPPEGVRNATDPLLARGRLLAAGLPTPWFVTLPPGATLAQIADRVRFPCVVRLLHPDASPPIHAGDPQALESAIDVLRRGRAGSVPVMEEDQEPRELLIEAFVPGREVSVEGVLEEGALRVLAMFDRLETAGPGDEPAVIDVTPSALDGPSARTVATAVAQVALVLGLHHGPVHASCHFNERDLYVRRVAPWPVGDARAQVLRFATQARGDVTFEELLLRQATGGSLDGFGREAGAAGVLRVPEPRGDQPRDVEGPEHARVPPTEQAEIVAAGGEAALPGRRAADEIVVVARGDEPAHVIQSLREAAAGLRGTTPERS